MLTKSFIVALTPLDAKHDDANWRPNRKAGTYVSSTFLESDSGCFPMYHTSRAPHVFETLRFLRSFGLCPCSAGALDLQMIVNQKCLNYGTHHEPSCRAIANAPACPDIRARFRRVALYTLGATQGLASSACKAAASNSALQLGSYLILNS